MRHKLAALEAEIPAAAAHERRIAEDAAVERRIAAEAAAASRAREERPQSSEESPPAPTGSGSSARESGSTRSQNSSRLQALMVLYRLKRLTFDVAQAYCQSDLPTDERIAVRYPEG